MNCSFVRILSDYVRYAILILRLGLEYTFVKSYTNTLAVISNIVFSMQIYTVTIIRVFNLLKYPYTGKVKKKKKN